MCLLQVTYSDRVTFLLQNIDPLKIPVNVLECVLPHLGLHGALDVRKLVVQNRVDVLSDRTVRVRILVEAKQRPVLHRLNGRIDIVEGDILQRPLEGDAARAARNADKPRAPKLRQNVPDDDRICLYAARQKVAGHFVGRLKRIHAGEDVKGNAETTGYLHGYSFASEITCSYFNARQL